MKALVPAAGRVWREGQPIRCERVLPEETPVAIVHDGSTSAVMMATPGDLEDFALGFSLSEGLIDTLGDVRSLEIAPGNDGIEARVWLQRDIGLRAASRRRAMVGPTGCGLCGIDSLAAAIPTPRDLGGVPLRMHPDAILRAMQALEARQVLGQKTRAVHAAGLLLPTGDLLVREDVGRHNALDKLIGANAQSGGDASTGLLLLTSRLSVEMVQKAAVLGAPIVCAISVPTALAVRTAEAAGITLIGIARRDGFEVFTRPDRIEGLS